MNLTKMALVKEFCDTLACVVEAILSVIQCVVLLAAVVFISPPFLMLGVAFSPIVLAIMAARRLNKCFTPPSELDEVLV